MSKLWVDYDDGHAGGYPHDCERCPTCGRTREDYRGVNCSSSFHFLAVRSDSIRCHCQAGCPCFRFGIHDYHEPGDCVAPTPNYPKEKHMSNEWDTILHGPHHEVVKPFRALPLVQKMRLAAEVLEEATRRQHPLGALDPSHADWRPVNLRYVADNFEVEDNAELKKKLKRVKEISELGDFLDTITDPKTSKVAIARMIIDAGWTKTDE